MREIQIKINKNNNSICFINNGICFSQFGVAKEILDLISNQQQEIERLNNIINELENELYKFYAYEGYNDEQIKDKIKELKGSDKDE